MTDLFADRRHQSVKRKTEHKREQQQGAQATSTLELLLLRWHQTKYRRTLEIQERTKSRKMQGHVQCVIPSSGLQLPPLSFIQHEGCCLARLCWSVSLPSGAELVCMTQAGN